MKRRCGERSTLSRTVIRRGSYMPAGSTTLDLGTLDDETAIVGLGNLPNLQSLTLNGREYTRGEFQEFAAQVLKRADALSKPTYGLLG
ncbi:hypothetical protein GobsT_40240 [Gemmata obscuriglobus]|nr:hypothetical protein [Gemmata obscuriglobus]QEG29234.1 hypothetical protein GobsT_40240 [Gemmata obscuriglobus]VTS08045.1 unnamed protein product [Gemmata obscuriglobus UQM 2246]